MKENKYIEIHRRKLKTVVSSWFSFLFCHHLLVFIKVIIYILDMMGMLFFICRIVCIRYKFYKLIFVSCFIFFWLSSFNKSIAELLTNSLSAREII